MHFSTSTTGLNVLQVPVFCAGLGVLHALGSGVPADEGIARALLTEACAEGSGGACRMLAREQERHAGVGDLRGPGLQSGNQRFIKIADKCRRDMPVGSVDMPTLDELRALGYIQ